MKGPITSVTTKFVPTEQNFSYWLARPYLDATARAAVAQANLLIVPYENIGGNAVGPTFSSIAPDLLVHLQRNAPSQVRAEICVAEAEYQELVLHGKLWDLGKVVVLVAVAPLAINLLSNYVQKRIDGGQTAIVRFELIIVEGDGRAKAIKYDGPADTFERVLKQQLASALPEEKPSSAPILHPRLGVGLPSQNGGEPLPPRDAAELSPRVEIEGQSRRRQQP